MSVRALLVRISLCLLATGGYLGGKAPQTAEAHPGGTDGNGCHVCRTNCTESWGIPYGYYHRHNPVRPCFSEEPTIAPPPPPTRTPTRIPPTATPVPPTNTPRPTATPIPTSTPVPPTATSTRTSTPTSTAMPAQTSTPLRAGTATPTRTATNATQAGAPGSNTGPGSAATGEGATTPRTSDATGAIAGDQDSDDGGVAPGVLGLITVGAGAGLAAFWYRRRH